MISYELFYFLSQIDKLLLLCIHDIHMKIVHFQSWPVKLVIVDLVTCSSTIDVWMCPSVEELSMYCMSRSYRMLNQYKN